MQRFVEVGGRKIEYTLNQKKVKNINMRIRMDGTVHVSARPSVGVKVVDRFVCSQADFIQKVQDKYKRVASETVLPVHYVSGESIPYLGERIPLVVRKGRPQQFFLSDDAFILQMWNTEDEGKREKAVQKGMRCIEEEILTQACKRMYEKVYIWGIEFPQIRFRTMKSRWGSCQPKTKVITLNRQLIMYPMEFIEYVVVHELAHFLQPNHSPAFYEKVAEILPDWKVRSKMNRVINEEIDYEN